MAGTKQPEKAGSTTIILVGPRYPENIGASARIAFNFGISRLIVVTDEQPDRERMLKMATHKAAHLIEGMATYQDIEEAVAPFHFIVATTARQGRQRLPLRNPREIMAEVAPLARGNDIALMFGPENTGLTSKELDFCQFASTIPTIGFSSLNLAQAVAIHCYELSMAKNEPPTSPGSDADFANIHQLEGMYGHIEQALITTTFLGEDNSKYWMRNIRHFLSRIRISKKEASMIRGICRKFLWHYGVSGGREGGV
ncbi:MAG: RNA methyltransferase [Desulfobulbaceae bacterium]|nr:RNA methyltransferase [Desulfobulbaceae bacterium]